jgi:beta-phosphoglucomutase-like phosphatase (HAD superfamily)
VIQYKAMFWDIDGVIVLSEPLHVEKINKTAENYGVQVSTDDWADWHGIGDHRIYEQLVDMGLPISEDVFIEECLLYYMDNKDRLTVRDGFREAFALCARQNLMQASVSSGVSGQVNANLNAPGVQLSMAFNLSASDIVQKGLKTKPAPDPYLEALTMLNAKNNTDIKAAECIVVEDSGSGVASCKAAGMCTIHWRPDIGHKIADIADYTAHDKRSFIQVISKLTL